MRKFLKILLIFFFNQSSRLKINQVMNDEENVAQPSNDIFVLDSDASLMIALSVSKSDKLESIA